MGKIKVLQVNKLYYPEVGGIEKTLKQLAEGLNESTDLQVLVCQKKGRGTVDCINGVRVCRTGSFGVAASVPISPSFVLRLRKEAKDKDIIHLHMPFPLGDLACLLSGFQGKIVAYWHSDVVKQKKWMFLYRPIMERFLKRADVILVGAEGIAKGSQYLTPYLEKCQVVPFAVEDRILQQGKEHIEKNGTRNKKMIPTFLFAGRLVYYKGCSILLEAFSKMKETAQLVIVGTGPLKGELEEQCKTLGIDDKVNFTGFVSDEQMEFYFRNADVFVLPSVERSEAFALVQLEAMAYGIPVINTNLPSGVPEVSIHKETGLTVAPADSEALCDAMDWMVKYPKEREAMGRAARKRLEENYTQEKMIDNMKRIYDSVLSR